MNTRGEFHSVKELITYLVKVGIIFFVLILFSIMALTYQSVFSDIEITQVMSAKSNLLYCLQHDLALETCFITREYGLKIYYDNKNNVINQKLLDVCGTQTVCIDDTLIYEHKGELAKATFTLAYEK